jgi:hypothetical protein
MGTTIHWGRSARAGLALLACFAAGCGGTGVVSGKVTYNNEPVGGGTVLLISTEGRGTGRSIIGPDGAYSVKDAPVGTVTITVETISVKPPRIVPDMPKPPEGAIPKDAPSIYGSKPSNAKYVEIPERYSDPETSGLTFTVKSGSQPHDIDLK